MVAVGLVTCSWTLWLRLLETCGDAWELCKLQQTSNCSLYIGILLLFLLAHWVTSYLGCIRMSGLFIASFVLDSQTTLSLITPVTMLSIIISILLRDHRSQGWKKHYLIMLDCKCWIEFSYIEYTIQGSLSLSASAKRPRRSKKLELRGSLACWKYCSSYWQNYLSFLGSTPCLWHSSLNKSGFGTFCTLCNTVFFLVLGSSVICWTSPYLQTSPRGLILCRTVYVSVIDHDAMVISKGCFIIDAN